MRKEIGIWLPAAAAVRIDTMLGGEGNIKQEWEIISRSK